MQIHRYPSPGQGHQTLGLRRQTPVASPVPCTPPDSHERQYRYRRASTKRDNLKGAVNGSTLVKRRIVIVVLFVVGFPIVLYLITIALIHFGVLPSEGPP